MLEIKTRDAVKGTIKTLDKAAIAGDRMKQVYPKIRPYQTNNYYDALLRQYQLEKEVETIVFPEEKADKRSQNACQSESQTAERN